MTVMVDRTGKLVEKSDIDRFGFSVRNMLQCSKSVFLQSLKLKEWSIERGKLVEEMIEIAEERESSSEQISTLFNEHRRTIIEECCEKVSHHEFQAARAEQERKIL